MYNFTSTPTPNTSHRIANTSHVRELFSYYYIHKIHVMSITRYLLKESKSSIFCHRETDV